MKRDRRLSVIVGSFVIASLGAVAAAVVLLSSESGIFTPRYRLFVFFQNVQGLLPGAPVWLAGKDVGRVERVDFVAATAQAPLRVGLVIDRSVQNRIRSDSVAHIGTIGLLGDSYLEVSVGSSDAEVLRNGASLEAAEPVSLDDAIETGTRALESVSTLASNLNAVVGKFSSGGGGEKAATAIDRLGDLVLAIQEGEGTLHNLIYRRDAGGLESLQRSLAALEDILEKVRTGDGMLHSVIYESPSDQDLVTDFLEAGANLNSVLEKANRGDGTLGLLLNDPSLYEDLKILVGGAQRSAVVRTLVRLAVGSDD